MLNREYARQIASQWNTKSAPFAGYVTEFEVQDAYLAQFETHIVGGRQHEELWVPAGQLAEFNRHILAQIRVVEAHFGQDFQGLPAENTALKGKAAVEQFIWLAAACERRPLEAGAELKTNNAVVFLHFPFWVGYDFSAWDIPAGLRQKTLDLIQKSWSLSFPAIQLGLA